MATVPVVDGNMSGGFIVMTHLTPSELAAMGQTVPGIHNVGNTASQNLRRFLKGEPKALGVVQIMIGVITFLFGIVLTTNIIFITFSVFSGCVYWGSVIYIITGSLTVAAENKMNSCLVKGSLGMNVVSAVTAALAIIFLSVDVAVLQCFTGYSAEFCILMMRFKAISVVLLIFSFLQFIISICISAFGCKAVCNNNESVQIVTMPNPAHTNPQVQMVIVSNPANTNPQDMGYSTGNIPKFQMSGNS